MDKLKQLEKRLIKIEKRNKRVELDKAWETSVTRRVILLGLTYLAISLYFVTISVTRPFVNAVVPAVGFWLSTLTLPFFRKIWEKYTAK